MRSAKRTRYYCDHCGKGSGSPSAMRRHERGCTLNAQRECGMCAQLGLVPTSRQELARIMRDLGFEAMLKTAADCPACVLSALRLEGYPDGGVGEWSFQEAKTSFWDRVARARMEAMDV